MLLALSKLTTFDEVCPAYSQQKYPSLSIAEIKKSLKLGLRMKYIPEAFESDANLTIMRVNLRQKLGFNRFSNSKITPRVTFSYLTVDKNTREDKEKVIEVMNEYLTCVDEHFSKHSQYADSLFKPCDLKFKPLFDEAMSTSLVVDNKRLWHSRKIATEYLKIKDNFTKKLLKSKQLFMNSASDTAIDRYFVRLECVSFDPTLFGIIHQSYFLKNRQTTLADRLRGKTAFAERIALYRRLARIIDKLHSLGMYHGKLRSEDFVQFSTNDDDFDNPLEQGVKLIVFPTNREDFLDVFEITPQTLYIDPAIRARVDFDDQSNDLIIKFSQVDSILNKKNQVTN